MHYVVKYATIEHPHERMFAIASIAKSIAGRPLPPVASASYFHAHIFYIKRRINGCPESHCLEEQVPCSGTPSFLFLFSLDFYYHPYLSEVSAVLGPQVSA